jgi:hypothetical protein
VGGKSKENDSDLPNGLDFIADPPVTARKLNLGMKKTKKKVQLPASDKTTILAKYCGVEWFGLFSDVLSLWLIPTERSRVSVRRRRMQRASNIARQHAKNGQGFKSTLNTLMERVKKQTKKIT